MLGRLGCVSQAAQARDSRLDILTTDYGELRTTKDGIGVKVRHDCLLSSDLDVATTEWSCSSDILLELASSSLTRLPTSWWNGMHEMPTSRLNHPGVCC